jgi:hypothetical protein
MNDMVSMRKMRLGSEDFAPEGVALDWGCEDFIRAGKLLV